MKRSISEWTKENICPLVGNSTDQRKFNFTNVWISTDMFINNINELVMHDVNENNVESIFTKNSSKAMLAGYKSINNETSLIEKAVYDNLNNILKYSAIACSRYLAQYYVSESNENEYSGIEKQDSVIVCTNELINITFEQWSTMEKSFVHYMVYKKVLDVKILGFVLRNYDSYKITVNNIMKSFCT